MTHEVIAKIDTKIVVHKDLEVVVKTDGRKLGTLLISKGNIEWVPKWKSVNKCRMNWQKFATMMQENGRAVKKR